MGLYQESGKDSTEKKKDRMKALLVAATDCEPLYLTRLLQVCRSIVTVFTPHTLGSLLSSIEFTFQAKLRLGFSNQTVLAALGQAAVYNEEHSKPPPKTKSPLEEVCFLFLLVALALYVTFF